MRAPAAAGGRAARAWIDGASRGNPGEAGLGLVFQEEGGGAEEFAVYLGRTTNNVAEYAAAIAALTLARRRGVARLELASDSELLVRQLGGRYKVRAPHLIPLFLRAQRLRRALSDVRIRHLPREENRAADRLANRAVDERPPAPDWLPAGWFDAADGLP